jgi:transposase
MRSYNTKFVVRLSEEERSELEGIVGRGRVAAAKRRRAQILLKSAAGPDDSGLTDAQVAEALTVGMTTVHRVRKAYVEQGLTAALERKPMSRRPRKLDGAAEAKLVALACSPPPEGRASWTMQLLADRLVELQIVGSISDDTVHRTLKKTTSSRG